MAGIACASQGGEERGATWPWRPSAQTARTMKEVGARSLRARRARHWLTRSSESMVTSPPENQIPVDQSD